MAVKNILSQSRIEQASKKFVMTIEKDYVNKL